jgi:quercetin dioxygenase-like cupin family protein
MHVLRKRTAPRYKRPDGIVSYLLASARTSDAEYLTTTLVEIDSGGHQAIHSHRPEQIYFILDGCGEMTVGEETSEVHAGDKRATEEIG